MGGVGGSVSQDAIARDSRRASRRSHSSLHLASAVLYEVSKDVDVRSWG